MFMCCENCHNKSAGSLLESLILHTHTHTHTHTHLRPASKNLITINKKPNGEMNRLAFCLF